MTFSKKTFFILVIFSLTFGVLFGQSASGSATENSGALSENEISLFLPDSAGNGGEAGFQGAKKTSVWPFIKMILALILVVAAIYGVLFLVRRKANPAVSEDNFLRRVAYLSLGQGKSVEVVTLVDKGAYLLGVTESGINLIAEVKDEELIQAMNLYSDKQKKVTKPRNFSDVLELFMPGGPREDRQTNIFDSSVNESQNMFQNENNSAESGASNE